MFLSIVLNLIFIVQVEIMANLRFGIWFVTGKYLTSSSYNVMLHILTIYHNRLAIGDDSLYRSLLLQCLGEENYEGSFVTNGFNRDVTKHAITVTELVLYIQNDGNDVTLAQLVTQWRAKKDVAPWYVSYKAVMIKFIC